MIEVAKDRHRKAITTSVRARARPRSSTTRRSVIFVIVLTSHNRNRRRGFEVGGTKSSKKKLGYHEFVVPAQW